MREFINEHFSFILLVCCVIGLFTPDTGSFATSFILILLGTIIFASFFKVELTKEALMSNAKKALIYFILRFVMLPIVVFFLIKPFSTYYAIVFMILFMLPSAVASPAFSIIFKANVNLSISILVLSSFFVILIIPYYSSVFIDDLVPIERWKMFKTLFFTIILPFLLHLPFRKNNRIKDWMMDYNTFIAIFCLAAMCIVIFAKYKHQILSSASELPSYLGLSFAGYLMLYLIGYFLIIKANKEDRITYSISSGANNIGLGVVLAVLYFPPNIVTFFIIADIAWVVLLIPVKWLFRQ